MSGMPIKTYQKTAIERRRLRIDYSCWLEETEMLIATQVTITPYTADAPLTVTTGYTDIAQKELVVFVGGGRPGVAYVMSFVVQTDQGQVKQDDIGMRLMNL
jgi:hypothetical protein